MSKRRESQLLEPSLQMPVYALVRGRGRNRRHMIVIVPSHEPAHIMRVMIASSGNEALVTALCPHIVRALIIPELLLSPE